MPVYLLHGFRWPRPLVRIHIILQNIDDAAAEWLIAPGTTAALLDNFHELYPETMKHLSHLRFIEQYDPDDISPGAASQPYAYVADNVHEIRLGVDVEEVRGKGVSNEQWSSLLDLRDRLAPEAKIGWFVVVCGDEERWAPPTVGLLQTGVHTTASARGSDGSVTLSPSVTSQREVSPEVAPKGFKKWFGSQSLRKKRSRASVKEIQPSDSSHSGHSPPLAVQRPRVVSSGQTA